MPNGTYERIKKISDTLPLSVDHSVRVYHFSFIAPTQVRKLFTVFNKSEKISLLRSSGRTRVLLQDRVRKVNCADWMYFEKKKKMEIVGKSGKVN